MDRNSFFIAVADIMNKNYNQYTFTYRGYCGELQVQSFVKPDSWRVSSSNHELQALYWMLSKNPGDAPLFLMQSDSPLTVLAGRAWLEGGGTL